MKRIDGVVTWEVLFDMRFVAGIRAGEKRQTVRRGEYVQEGDALRLAGPDGVTVHEVNASEVEQVLIRTADRESPEGWPVPDLFVRLGMRELNAEERIAFAKADGFESPADMRAFLEAAGMLEHGILDGQVIRW